MDGVFSFVSRNGDAVTVKSMLSDFDHCLFDIEAAVISASLSHKYDNVRMILDCVNVSKLNFECLFDCLAKKNALNINILDILMNTAQQDLQEMIIETCLKHSPLSLTQILKLYASSHKSKFSLLLKACSQSSLQNVLLLFKTNFKNSDRFSVLQCINSAVTFGQYHIASWFIQSLGKEKYDGKMMVIVKLLVYKMFNSKLLLEIKNHCQMPQHLRSVVEKFIENYQMHTVKTINQVFPAQVTTNIIASIFASLEKIVSNRQGLSDIGHNLKRKRTKGNFFFGGWRGINITLKK